MGAMKLLALGAGLAPHLTRAVFDGMTSMAGEFVRTPKKGSASGRYRARADWPWLEAGRVRPVIHRVFSAAEPTAAAEAHALMESSTHVGKIVLNWA